MIYLATCGIGITMRTRTFLDRVGRKKCPHITVGKLAGIRFIGKHIMVDDEPFFNTVTKFISRLSNNQSCTQM